MLYFTVFFVILILRYSQGCFELFEKLHSLITSGEISMANHDFFVGHNDYLALLQEAAASNVMPIQSVPDREKAPLSNPTTGFPCSSVCQSINRTAYKLQRLAGNSPAKLSAANTVGQGLHNPNDPRNYIQDRELAREMLTLYRASMLHYSYDVAMQARLARERARVPLELSDVLIMLQCSLDEVLDGSDEEEMRLDFHPLVFPLTLFWLRELIVESASLYIKLVAEVEEPQIETSLLQFLQQQIETLRGAK